MVAVERASNYQDRRYSKELGGMLSPHQYDPSSQLLSSLHYSIAQSLKAKRPILVHVNADTTWLLQLPYPEGATKPAGRCRFNILIDPWLSGPQSDLAFWFSCQSHTTKSSVQTIAELENILVESESIASTFGSKNAVSDRPCSYIDAVIVSHEFTDHCHRATLLELDDTIPVYATSRAAKLIRSWRYFHQVIDTSDFPPHHDPDWRSTSLAALPEWVGISHMISRNDALNYHSAIVITFDLSGNRNDEQSDSSNGAEGIIYTPHGIDAGSLNMLQMTVPRVKTLALLHGLHNVWLSKKQLNLGAMNGLQARRISEAKYWISTHDEVKKASGLISSILYRKAWTLQEALDAERKTSGQSAPAIPPAVHGSSVTVAEMRSGEGLILW